MTPNIMKNRHTKRMLSLVLCLSMIFSLFTGSVQAAGSDPYILSFQTQTPEDMGSWQLDKAADPTWTLEQAVVYDTGYKRLAVSAGTSGKDDCNTIVSDQNAPEIDDGYLEIEMTSRHSEGRVGVYFRYTDPQNALGLMYDSYSGWQLRINGKDQKVSGIPAPVVNQPFTLRVEYVGTRIRILVDGDEAYNQEVTGTDIGAGKIGLRVWGWSTFVGKMDVSRLEYGTLDSIPEGGTGTPGGETVGPDGLIDYTLPLDRTDNWEQTVGDSPSTIELRNGAFFTQTGEGNEGGSPAYALIYDKESPDLENGELQARLENNANGRFCLVFRYQDPQNYAAIGYDFGNWVAKSVVNGKETTENFNGPDPRNAGKKDIKITFWDTSVSMALDGETLYTSSTLLEGAPAAGKLGIRTWGYAGNYASVTVHSLTYNQTPKPEFDPDGNYMVTFTDENTRGGWQQDAQADSSWANRGITFTDGADDQGYMTVSAGPSGSGNGEAKFSDTRAPSIENGFLEMDLTNLTDNGRIGIYFRYQSADNAVGLMYDVGSWNVQYPGGSTAISVPALEKDQTYRIRIEYVGDNIRVLWKEKGETDFQEVANQSIPGIDIGAGRIGMRTWGYSTIMASAKVDNIVNGEYNAVLLDPSEVFLMKSDSPYDLNITLSQTGNALTGIRDENGPLREGDDYTAAGDVVTLKAAYMEQVQTSGKSQTLSFTFADGYISTLLLKVQGDDEAEEFYQRDFSQGMDGFEKKTGSGTVVLENGAAKAIANNSNSIFIDNASPDLRNVEAEFTFDPLNDNGNLSLVLRYAGENDWLAVGIGGVGGNHTQWYAYTPTGSYPLFGNNDDSLTENGGNSTGDGQRLYSGRAKPYTMKVRVVENTITVWVDGSEILQSTISGLPDSAGKVGVRYTGNSGAYLHDLTVRTSNLLEPYTGSVEEKTISSGEMTVSLDKDFPRVISYELGGKTMAGQKKAYRAVEINNTLTEMQAAGSFEASRAVYRMQGSLDGEDVTMDVVFTVEGNVLSMELQNVSENIRTVSFPNQSLVSVSSDEPGAALRESNYTKEHVYDLTTRPDSANHKYTSLAVINNDELAAAVNGGSFKMRGEICYQTVRVGSATSTGLWPNEYILRGLNNEPIDCNWAKVAITDDRNSDGKIDYQDGAIALRDDIPNNWVTNSNITSAYTSIAVNEASWAQYPFLTSLDNIKKMSLGTDNFPQIVLYKGYQSQGHDAGHPNFADINQQAGGVEDFQTLTRLAADYNTTIGVHINETEVYPESPQYGVLASDAAGWFWFDQANQMIRENDILEGVDVPEGNMYQRLDDLDAAAGGNLGMVYVDTYFDNRWPAYSLATTLNDHGWAVGTEYIDELSGYSVWAHHIDGTYNNAGNLVRFVTNGTKDIFAYSNLFRGPNNRHEGGIFGWQADNSYGQNYQSTLEDFYTLILPNKYLANFPIMQWESNEEARLGDDVVTTYRNGVNEITKNGKLILTGNQHQTKLFIPWDPETEEKIYHWNYQGGESSWELPDSWNGESTVKMFRLSDQGRTDMQEIPVQNGSVSLTVDAKTPYVIYKGSDTSVTETDMTTYHWTDGGHVQDAGFDSHTWGYAWDVSSTSGSTDHIVYSNENGTVISEGDTNALIQGTADGTLHQTITGLEGGETYAISVYADVSEGRRASLTVTTADGQSASQYIDSTYNGYYGGSHTSKKGSSYQRMEVRVTIPEGKSAAELYLTAGAGSDSSAYARFDDVRVYKLDKETLAATEQEAQKHYYFDNFNDFAVGFGFLQNGLSGANHMSETSDFNNDTIEGRYSLKIQELGKGSGISTPAALRFPANTKCTVTFDYLLGSNATYNVSAREKDGSELASVQLIGSGMGSQNKKQASLTFTTGDSGAAYLELTYDAKTTIVLDNIAVDIDQNAPGASMQINASVAAGNGRVQVEGATEGASSSASALIGSNAVIHLIPDEGNHIESVTVNGVPHPITSETLTLLRIQENAEISVIFAESEPLPDVSELHAAIKSAEALDRSKYQNDANMEIFLKALEAAKAMLENPTTQAEVDQALADLQTAQKNLTPITEEPEEPENPDPPKPSNPSDSWEENQPGYIGNPLPTTGSETGSSYPPMSSSFVSDTTTDFTITGGSYQFRITSKDGTVPVMTVTNSAFRVELVSQEGNDYFFRVTVVTPGQTADVLVNGGKVVSVTGGDAPGGVISDTTAPFQVSENGEYQFKLTANEKPDLVAGSSSFTVEFVKNEGKDWFFRIRATGKPGDACGFYINKSPKPVTVVTIA